MAVHTGFLCPLYQIRIGLIACRLHACSAYGDGYGHTLVHHIAACTQAKHFRELPNVDNLAGILDALWCNQVAYLCRHIVSRLRTDVSHFQAPLGSRHALHTYPYLYNGHIYTSYGHHFCLPLYHQFPLTHWLNWCLLSTISNWNIRYYTFCQIVCLYIHNL